MKNLKRSFSLLLRLLNAPDIDSAIANAAAMHPATISIILIISGLLSGLLVASPSVPEKESGEAFVVESEVDIAVVSVGAGVVSEGVVIKTGGCVVEEVCDS